MTWLAQMGHVALKDVRQFWWLLLLYAAIVAAVTANARAGGPAAGSIVVTLDAFIVVAFGMATAATVVQSDSPSRSTAFWATRPLDPSAVLTAKLVLVALGVVGLGVLGEIVGLEALGLRAAAIIAFVMRSIGLYAIWLVTAILVAALTADFRAFVITLIVAVIAFFALGQMLFVDRYGVLHLSAWIPAIGGLIALGALAYRYQRRDASRIVWALAAVGVFAAFLFLLTSARIVTGQPPMSEKVAPAMLAGTGGIVNHDQLVLHLRAVDSDSLHAYGFFCDTLIVHLRDGSLVPLEPRFAPTYLQSAALPAVGAVRWRPESRVRDLGVAAYDLNEEERAALAPGVTAIDVGGRVNEYVPELASVLPLRAGQSLARDGQRLQIEKVVNTTDSLLIELRRASIGDPEPFVFVGNDTPDPFTWSHLSPRFALVNRLRGEGVLLNSRGSETSNGWVVLPGAPVQQSTMRLAPMRAAFPRDTLPRDAAWYSDAQLYVFRWRAGGTYRVHARIAVP